MGNLLKCLLSELVEFIDELGEDPFGVRLLLHTELIGYLGSPDHVDSQGSYGLLLRVRLHWSLEGHHPVLGDDLHVVAVRR
jgi:hypothetical protein